jgi:hypothetical protein
MNPFEAMFGRKVKPEGTEKPLEHGSVEYIGGHEACPQSTYSEIYFYEDRIELQAYKLKIPFNQIKNVDSTREWKRHEDWAALGIVGLVWKKNAVYTIIEYNDGVDDQKVIIDFGNNANYAQGLIYKKMVESRK